jgi:hypothetical protein
LLRPQYTYSLEATTDTQKAGLATAHERLLDGEYPATVDLADARHWHQVYSELVRFTEDALALSRPSQAALVSGAAAELEADLQLIARQRDRLRSRLEFWEQKLRALGPDIQPVA